MESNLHCLDKLHQASNFYACELWQWWHYVKVRKSRNFFVASDSSKKGRNEFIFCQIVLLLDCFMHFLEEFENSTKSFRNYLTFSFLVRRFKLFPNKFCRVWPVRPWFFVFAMILSVDFTTLCHSISTPLTQSRLVTEALSYCCLPVPFIMIILVMSLFAL